MRNNVFLERDALKFPKKRDQFNITLHLIHISKMQDLDLTPNQQDDVPTRIQHAKAFLQENPDEQPMTAARIYDLTPSTLYSLIQRPFTKGRGG
jgi:hypothetical protein